MQGRFAFRQIDTRDIEMFFRDGEIRSKNHSQKQDCHQTSYDTLVELRSKQTFAIPTGGVVNDYVAFYFSPVTSFTHTIHKGNVDVTSPQGHSLGKSCQNDRAFIVFCVEEIFDSGAVYCFSDAALNSANADVKISSDRSDLPAHVDWAAFDEGPVVAKIPEIGYKGVCKYFQNAPKGREHRAQRRMAELLVHGAVPLALAKAIVLPTDESFAATVALAAQYGFQGQVVNDPTCFI